MESPVSQRRTVTVLLLLTFATGLVDAVSVLVLGHVFVANMTGNVSSLSDHLATAHWGQAVFFFTVIIIFILGAAISSLLINSGRRRGIAAIYAYSILLEAILLAVLGIADIWGLCGHFYINTR